MSEPVVLPSPPPSPGPSPGPTPGPRQVPRGEDIARVWHDEDEDERWRQMKERAKARARARKAKGKGKGRAGESDEDEDDEDEEEEEEEQEDGRYPPTKLEEAESRRVAEVSCTYPPLPVPSSRSALLRNATVSWLCRGLLPDLTGSRTPSDLCFPPLAEPPPMGSSRTSTTEGRTRVRCARCSRASARSTEHPFAFRGPLQARLAQGVPGRCRHTPGSR